MGCLCIWWSSTVFFFWVVCEIDVDWDFSFNLLILFRNWTRMAKEASNGNHNSATKAPPTPSPLRFSKYFQVLTIWLFFPFINAVIFLFFLWYSIKFLYDPWSVWHKIVINLFQATYRYAIYFLFIYICSIWVATHVALSFGLQGKEVTILKLNAEVIILKSSAI